jgi:hypothetical protein
MRSRQSGRSRHDARRWRRARLQHPVRSQRIADSARLQGLFGSRPGDSNSRPRRYEFVREPAPSGFASEGGDALCSGTGPGSVAASSHRRPRRCRIASSACRCATTSPACQPGARPPDGGRIEWVAMPPRASNHAITELEFHMSPVASSSRPHTRVGTSGTRSSTRRARSSSSVSRCGLSTASSASGMRPFGQRRIS